MKAVYEKTILGLRSNQLYPRGRPMDPRFLVKRNPIMDRKTPVASMGSCFAANIKGFLVRSGFNYVQTSNAPGPQVASAAWGTVYNTFCIAQEFARANGEFHPAEEEWDLGKGGLWDPYRKGIRWRDREAAIEERAEHAQTACRAIKEAEVFILTAGITEIWFSKKDGSVFFQVPPPRVFDEGRHGFMASSFEANKQNLHNALRDLRRLNPDCHVILTVSPVPLRATFRETNVVTANAQSKAVLLAAVHDVVENSEERVHYFPGYELVTVITRNPYKPDNRHVRPEVLKRVMELFTRSFVR